MKEKRKWKRWLCAMLALVLLCTFPGTAFGAEKPEWYYEDSILCYVKVDESRSFSPEDFSVIDCKKVFVLAKEQLTEEGKVQYLLVLMLNSPERTSLKENIEKLLTLPMVSFAKENDRFVADYSRCFTLEPAYCYLAIDETVEVSVGNCDNANWEQILGIKFRPDSASFDMNALQTDSFSEYGIYRFWPDLQQGLDEQILRPYSRPKDLEAKKSENGWYYGLAGEENEYLFDTVARLSAAPEILSVSITSWSIRGRSLYNEAKSISVLNLAGDEETSEKIRNQYWSIVNTDIADYTLHSFEDMNGLTDSILTVRGVKSGITKLSCEESYFDSYTVASCTIIVYEPGSPYNPGDVNYDSVIDADDALQVLRHIVGRDFLEEPVRYKADLNQNNLVDTDDALLMLKIASGVL